MTSFSAWKRRSSKRAREKKASKGRKEKTPTAQDQSEVDVDAGSDGKQ